MKNVQLFVWFYLGLITIIFAIQMYLFYFDLIPAALAPLKDAPALESHVHVAISKLVGSVSFWFLLSVGSTVGYLLASRKNAKQA